MKKIELNHKSKFSFLNNNSSLKGTLINSLSPNFFYINKFGGIVHPVQCYLY
jgi:hypothetical protein